LEGKPPEPRIRPPFPAQSGVRDAPTNINNVETWANVPEIIDRGGKWFSGIGTESSKGTKVFSVVGKVRNTGLVEVPMGITLQEIVFDIGGGIPNNKKFKAVQTGGPSGGCIPTSLLNLPIDYEKLAEVGSIMGSGGLIVMDEDTCMVDVARYFLEFLKDESCGKCTACREGVGVMHQILTNICDGNGKEEDIEMLEELAQAVKDASLCALGGTAPNPVLSTIRYFRDEYEAHIKYKRCPAGVCRGIISAACQHTCPIEQDVPCYIGLCRAGEGDGEEISIRVLKRFLADYEREKGLDVIPKPKQTRSEKVAIIGSGPAGLTCAYYLALEGYGVTIFESLPVVGGMLAVGIPDYRLPKSILDWEIENIKKLGVEFKTNTVVGKDVQISYLQKQYKAIFIATGAHKGLKMQIEGEELPQVIDAVDFLRAQNIGQEIEIGQNIAVIGGGDAAIDAARVAKRLGKDVKILYRRTRREMPATKEEIEGAIDEGIEIQFLVAPVKVLSENGQLKGIECIKMELGELDRSGRRRPVPIEGSEFTMEIDTLMPAVGQQPDLSALASDDRLKTTRANTIDVDPESLSSGVEGIFAGGDVVSGPNAVTAAMAHGKIAAKMIHNYIQQLPLERGVDAVELTDKEIEELQRPAVPLLSLEERSGNFEEVELGFTEEMAIKEAKRCLRCDLELKEEGATA
jgi:NADH-quinone oxidoreductase subunit F